MILGNGFLMKRVTKIKSVKFLLAIVHNWGFQGGHFSLQGGQLTVEI